jgi:phosphatidylserine/phosphatidylglycerophosphate/cardiolipin synthase-like enzyme
VVISEAYGGGGNLGSTWTHDFVELYNPTSASVTMTNWSIQYQSATGSGAFSQRAFFSGTIASRGYFLIQLARGAGGTTALPTPDVIPTNALALSATAGKVALVKDTLSITNPTDPNVVDFVGYGSTANKFEGSGPAPAPSNSSSIERKASANATASSMAPGGSDAMAGNGYDTDNNNADFVTQSAIVPQNSASPKEPPVGSDLAGIGTARIDPSLMRADTGLTLKLTVRGSTQGTITIVQFPKVQPFNWAQVTFDVEVTRGASPTLQVGSESVRIINLMIDANDSVVVRAQRLSVPDTTMYVDLPVATAAGGDSTALISRPPRLLLYGKPRPIFNVRMNRPNGVPMLLGQPVTVRGIVTVGNEFKNPAYLQDASGGIAIFDHSFVRDRAPGDDVTLTGTITQFFGLTELENVVVHQLHSAGNVVTPLTVTASELRADTNKAIEKYESMLVTLRRVRVLDQNNQPPSRWFGNTNYRLVDLTDTIALRIDGETDLVGRAVPSGEFEVIGIVGQFVSAPPFIGGYQILPRSSRDILTTGPTIVVAPQESQITPTSMVVRWSTATPSNSRVLLTSYATGAQQLFSRDSLTTEHAVALSGLTSASLYTLRAYSVSGFDTSFASPFVVSTASQGSTGQIRVYFNKSVNTTLSRFGAAAGEQDYTSLLIRRIQQARWSIDCALYSLSGVNGDLIARELVQARNRGVKVRMIFERDNLNAGTGTVVNQFLTPAGVPWISDDFDLQNAGSGLHHNKFFVFDYRGGREDSIWVWTGSWNPTDPGTNADMQNVVEIQDKALAGAYTLEFEEMWGSSGDVPQQSTSRFGTRKTDNTPHRFNINGILVECYFSPSDRAAHQVARVLSSAQHSINFAMMTLTRGDLASTLLERRQAGVKVRGVMDNNTDSGSQYASLAAGGIDVRLDPNTSALLHHKYAVTDAERMDLPQWVITGSMNWTTAGEMSNNENTLLILDRRIANEYLQEFAARYRDAGGTDNIVVRIEELEDARPVHFTVSQNYPNPFNPATSFLITLPRSAMVEARIFDLLGRELELLVRKQLPAGTHRVTWQAGERSSGVYLLRVAAEGSLVTRKLLLVR